jgi:hypothetical protein
MKWEALMRTDRKWIWAIMFLWFLMMELALQLKLGVIFWLCWGWFLVLDWETKRVFGQGFSKNPADRILKSCFYAFGICLLIFLVFSFFNILLRSFNNDLRFFQLP